jgi:hypothetical protein
MTGRDALDAADAQSPRFGGYLLGFLLVLGGAVLGMLTEGTWPRWVDWAGEPWTSESWRWALTGILIISGISFLRSKPIALLLTAALVMLTAYTADLLLAGRMSAVLASVFGPSAAPRVVPVCALALGYLIHTAPSTPHTRQGAFRGVFGLVLITLAAAGTVHGWYDWALLKIAHRLGPGVLTFVSDWTAECTWAVALILTAIGVASSRTRTIHFLSAVLLMALAFHCVQGGYLKVESFPTLDKVIETESWKHVELWRWVAAGELVLFALILLHQSLGMGALNLAFALAWMIAGVHVYQSIGSLSNLRYFSDTFSGSLAATADGGAAFSLNPLANMGLPVAPQQPGRQGATAQPRPGSSERASKAQGPHKATPKPATAAELSQARADAIAAATASDRHRMVREVARQTWVILTSLLAGIVGIAGLRMLLRGPGLRLLAFCALWVLLVLSILSLWSIAPQIVDQDWTLWLVAWTQSKCHLYAAWTAFLAAMAIAGSWAMLGKGRTESWVRASICCTFVGTALSLIGVAVLIRFGGFPRLPAWTYITIAVGQSSMAWVLMMHLSLSERRRPARRGIA